MAAAQQLKYYPNAIARSLHVSRTNIIAVVMGIQIGYFFEEIFFEIVKKIQESRLNLVKKLLLSKEKPHFRRSAVWQAAPFKITMISPVFSRVSAIFGNPFPSWRGVLLDGHCATQKDIA